MIGRGGVSKGRNENPFDIVRILDPGVYFSQHAYLSILQRIRKDCYQLCYGVRHYCTSHYFYSMIPSLMLMELRSLSLIHAAST